MTGPWTWLRHRRQVRAWVQQPEYRRLVRDAAAWSGKSERAMNRRVKRLLMSDADPLGVHYFEEGK